MNKRILYGALLVAVGAMSQTALAGPGYHGDGYERAWVYAPVRHHHDAAIAAIVGGTLGAIVGNNLAYGDARPAATVGGAIAGAIIGSQLAHEGRREVYVPRYARERHCRR